MSLSNNSKPIRILTSLLIGVVLAGILSSCGSQQPTPVVMVAPPSISEPKVGAPSPQQPGEEIGISIEIASIGGVTLNYTWTADGGEIVRGQNSPAITYRVPEESGTYNVRVKIEWDGQSIEKVTSIKVEGTSTEATPILFPDTPEPTEEPTPKLPTNTPEPADTPTPSSGSDSACKIGIEDETPAGGLTVVDSFPTLLPKVHGLAFDGAFLWAVDQEESKIYKLDMSGNIISSFDSPAPSPTGLTFDGTYLWNTSDATLNIYQLDTSGTVITSFQAPRGDSTGLTFDGTYLWNAGFSSGGRIYKIDTSGNLICSFNAPDSSPEGLAFDGIYVWNIDIFTNKIHQLNRSGKVIASFDSPGTDEPIGLTFDGTYLWLADRSNIYKLRLD